MRNARLNDLVDDRFDALRGFRPQRDRKAGSRPALGPRVQSLLVENPVGYRDLLLLEAAAGLPTPPYSAQVAGLNCSPPYMPLPVLAAQLPPDSHCATASQFTTGAAFAVAGRGTSTPRRTQRSLRF